MEIRPYEPSDLHGIVGLYTDSVHVLGASQYDRAQLEAWAPRQTDLKTWGHRMDDTKTLVAEIDGDLAGFISYRKEGEIDLLFTSPRYPRRGVATALYQRAEEAMLANDVEEIGTDASLVSKPFFEKMGFQVEREERVVRNGVPLVRYRMRKEG